MKFVARSQMFIGRIQDRDKDENEFNAIKFGIATEDDEEEEDEIQWFQL